jgi:hypothetical protein
MKVSRIEKHERFAFLLICLFVWAGASQGVVVCVGFDGHVALEPAFHERCHHHVHAEEIVAGQPTEEISSHSESRHCQPCIDIPVSLGLPRDYPQPAKLQPRPPISNAPVNGDMTVEAISMFAGVSEPFYITTPYFDPLRTIILLV